ncbi:MAG: glutathione S-transferase N-terminal domain-containing protein [Sodalis sp. (in: enterobacteria)]|uniref:glutathione S-transferase N-terminal domain-containing protein n=1 Tax=Sodalis sp. (in: enterobacteria) TaxID=1898979 RepID=UPI003F400478
MVSVGTRPRNLLDAPQGPPVCCSGAGGESGSFTDYVPLRHTVYLKTGKRRRIMKLIGSYSCPFVRKILMILLEKNLPFTLVHAVDSTLSTAISPLGCAPVLIDAQGETHCHPSLDRGLSGMVTARTGITAGRLP